MTARLPIETFHWDEHFTTGIASVDEQHLRLVHLINALGESLIACDGQAPGSLHAAFEQLAEYAQQHFRQEEALMVSEGLAPAYRLLHENQHAEFGRQLAMMWAARDSGPNTAEVLHGFLRAWLAMHILGEDQSMARQIRALRSGQTPDEAYHSESSSDDNATAALLIAIKGLYRVLAKQNTDLVNANQQLEARVLERTQALAEANQRLEVLSNSDALLGIANRRHFDTRLDAEWRRGAREHSPLSLLMIDVDHFKRYNDRYGHPAGDVCLQLVARAAGEPPTLKRPADLLARYGGEELVVLLPDTPSGGARVVAYKIQRAIADLHLRHDASPVGPELTVSIGVATAVPTPDAMATTLLEEADAALYAAKAAGRNGIVVHA
jgi:hemerythrin